VGQYIQVLINNRDGTFRDETASRLPQADNDKPWIKFIELLDIDGDGSLDIGTRLAALEPTSPPFYLNDGNGFFSPLSEGLGKVNNLWATIDATGTGHRDFYYAAAPAPCCPLERHFVVRDIGPVLPPGIPQGLFANKGQLAGRVRLIWSYVWGATSYEVWRSPTPSSTGVLLGTTRSTTFDDTSAAEGQFYYYFVRALNSAGTSGYSGPAIGYVTSATPLLGLNLDGNTFAPGNTLHAAVVAGNPGPQIAVDFYFGVLLPSAAGATFGCPGSDAIVFFAAGFRPVLRCLSASPQTFEPLAQNVSLPAAFPLTNLPNFFSVVWPPDAPPGTYMWFVAFTRAGTLDLLTVAADSVSFTP
jgi:hypothetical protein